MLHILLIKASTFGKHSNVLQTDYVQSEHKGNVVQDFCYYACNRQGISIVLDAGKQCTWSAEFNNRTTQQALLFENSP
jgi:hypothetical protein